MAFRAFNTARKAARTAGYANMSTQAAAVEGKSNNMVKAGVAAVAGLVGYGAYNVAENKGYVVRPAPARRLPSSRRRRALP